MKNKKIVELKEVSKEIHGQTILKNISISFESGNIYGIIGHNGSGKTMLFKAICGLINPTKGEIKVFDEVINKGNFPKNTGVLIESPGLLGQFSALRNLKILASINNKINEEEIKKFISLVNLNPEDKRNVKKYSLGMKQRLGIAQALMEDPELIILDEPMNGLDKEGISLIRTIILDLKKKNKTIILASHNSEDINILCDYVFEMDNGVLSEKVPIHS
ncbi:ABC transporter ATP-binding protein [Clostridium tarantellae]|uniref:ATP-binding cassette domain-containing protein n=1 Tax=Clostridium tarantellae TaxID=39493 RepID=A0A6I1ML04_9CLOT|nr:ABC transporter ATP-binding protein [Clostridium tarantellae]MPQ42892.1 ATP-binding cassette domain-containing protein [Clostridium tarantellae]